MVYEWGDVSRASDIASAVKPVISTLLLLAIQEKRLASPDSLVSEVVPELRSLDGGKNAAISWRHLASQTSGYGLAESPGAAYAYNDFALALYYDSLMDRVFGGDGTEVLRKRFATPLGFEDRFTFDAFGRDDRKGRLAISVRDLARFGLLILREGTWRGKRIIDPSLLKLSLHSPVPAGIPRTSGKETPMLPRQRTLGGGRDQTAAGPGRYSFNWWLNSALPDGTRLYPDAPADAVIASGHWGRRMLWIVPSLDLVVAWNDASFDDSDRLPGDRASGANRAGALLAQAALWVGPRLGVAGERFTVDGSPTFLLGISYYGGLSAPQRILKADLAQIEQAGFNWIRVWATWQAGGEDVSAVAPDGRPRPKYLARLRELVAACSIRGLIVDVTLSRGDRAAGPPRLADLESHRRAVETIAEHLRPFRNWYLDLANERNVRDARFVSLSDIAVLREAVRKLDPDRLVTASDGGDIPEQEVGRYLKEAGTDFLCPHRPRDSSSPWQTEERTRRYLRLAAESGKRAPVHYQEPFRRNYGLWQPEAADFLADLAGALRGGAAGWCLHNGSSRAGWKGSPKSFDLRKKGLFEQFDEAEREVVQKALGVVAGSASPRVEVRSGQWRIGGVVTYAGTACEGHLMTVRMANALFEDRNQPGFDAEANTDALIRSLPDYAAHGVRAISVNLQGGMPGYEGARNSAFDASGSLLLGYVRRAERLVEACGREGIAVILGCYYQRQDQVLRDEEAVRAGVRNVAVWIRAKGWRHVLVEIANEFGHGGYDHDLLKTPEGIVALIREAKRVYPALLVSASGLGDGLVDDAVASVSDFLLVHFNGLKTSDIPSRVRSLRRFGKPIICSEDDRNGADAAEAMEVCVRAGASYGLMLLGRNQTYPFRFEGAADDPVFYRALRNLTIRKPGLEGAVGCA